MGSPAVSWRTIKYAAFAGLAGVFVYWIWPVHFGLSRTGEDPFLITSVIGLSSQPRGQLQNEYPPYRAYCSVYANVPDIETLLPAGNLHGPIPLTNEQLNAILPRLPSPQYQEFNLSSLPYLNNNSILLNPQMGSWAYLMTYSFWIDSLHRFVDPTIALFRNINLYAEGRAFNSRTTIRLTVISKGSQQYLTLAPDMPPRVAHLGLARFEMDYAVGEFPAYSDGIYAFKIKSQPENPPNSKPSRNALINNTLLILEIHPTTP